MNVDAAYAYCRRIAHKHGGNFSVGFRFLPRVKRRAVYAAYAYCRWADDIADEPSDDVDDVLERLDEWQRELDACYAGAPHHPITIALADALQHFSTPKSAFVALIDGCRQDTWKTRYETFEELLQYCDLVATSISDISLSIYGFKTDAAPLHGRNLAIALQLTNVTRDVGDDLPRNRIYLPRTELLQFGVTEEELFAGAENERVEKLIAFQIDRAEGYFRAAEPRFRRSLSDPPHGRGLRDRPWQAEERPVDGHPPASITLYPAKGNGCRQPDAQATLRLKPGGEWERLPNDESDSSDGTVCRSADLARE